MADCTAEMSVRTPRSEQVEEVLGALKTLRGLGMRLAQQLVDDVTAPADDAPALAPAEAAIAFQRISKAVRMTAALELRVLEAADGARFVEAQARAEGEQRAAEERRRQGRDKKGAVADIVFDILAEAAHDLDCERYRQLDEGLLDWTREDRDHEDFAHMDERAMLDAICEALGLVPDPALWDRGEYVEALASAILGPEVRPETPVATAVRSARASLSRAPETAAPP